MKDSVIIVVVVGSTWELLGIDMFAQDVIWQGQ